MITRQLIRADGTIVKLERKVSMAEIRTMIGAETLDTVLLRHMGQPLHVMIVDDAGWNFEVQEYRAPDGRLTVEAVATTPRLPLNRRATELYHANCRQGATHQIAGDVVIVPDEDFA